MPDDPVIFDRQSAELIKTTVLAEMARIKNRLLPEGIDTGRRSSDQWVPFINASSATIPERAIMAVIGSTFDDQTNTQFLKVNKPSTTFYRQYAVNGALESTAEGSGLCAVSGPVQVLYDSSSSPAIGDGYGPKPGSWAVFKGYPQTTTILGTVDTTTGIAHAVMGGPISSLVGKTDASIAAIATNAPGSGAVSIYALVSSTLTDTNQNVTAYNMTATAVSSGVYVQLKYIDGVPWVDVESCP